MLSNKPVSPDMASMRSAESGVQVAASSSVRI